MTPERKHPFEETLRKTKIGIDVDGTVAFSAIPVMNKVNEDFKTNAGMEIVSRWYAVRDFVYRQYRARNIAADLALKMAKRYDDCVWTNPEVLGKAPLVEGTSEFILRLNSLGIEYYFITSRIPALKEVTLAWFAERLPFVDSSRIVFNTDSKTSGKEFKWREMVARGIGLAIEDSEDHARLIIANTAASVILLPYPDETQYTHPRLFRLEKPGRLTNMRDVHKLLLLHGQTISVAQS